VLRNRGWSSRLLLVLCGVVTVGPGVASAGQPERPQLLVAYATFRERPLHPIVYFYRLDGTAGGEVIGQVTPANKRSDVHPALSRDGTRCVFCAEAEGKIGTIRLWDRSTGKLVDLPEINETPNSQMSPAFCQPNNMIAFEAWNRPGSSGRWDILLYDIGEQKFVETPNLNSADFDERKPTITADGHLIAFTTNAVSAESRTDIRLYDRKTREILVPPGLNSPHMDTEPSLSADGQLVAFVSDRPGGKGARDIWLYDRRSDGLLPLPRLNSAGQEQSPSLSPDGRFLAFVSERLDGAGERDVFVYDRRSETLVPTPGLNSPADEYDPCLVPLTAGRK